MERKHRLSLKNLSLGPDQEHAVNGKGGGGGSKRRKEAKTITKEFFTGTRLSRVKWRESKDYH